VINEGSGKKGRGREGRNFDDIDGSYFALLRLDAV
jgi:hypothetical protein